MTRDDDDVVVIVVVVGINSERKGSKKLF